ncbi:MAG: hypothetical protein IPL27_07215 [Lewinellaceae bacterium]|nr:hypothetical protein [Lewinellaceae bacterium]
MLNVQADQLDEDFVGVKIGDVNGTVIANSLQSVEDRTAATMLFDVQDRTVKAGEVFTVHFKGAERVQGYQFTMNFNGLEVQDIIPGKDMKLDNFGVFADAITTSVDGAANEFATFPRYQSRSDQQDAGCIQPHHQSRRLQPDE